MSSSGTIYWVSRWYAPDGEQKSLSFGTYADAKNFGAKVTLDPGIDPKRSATRLCDYAADWQRVAAITHRSTTADLVDGHLRNHVLPQFGNWPLDRINTGAVQQWATDLGERLAPSTVSSIVRVLSMVMGAAIRDGYIDASPTTQVRVPQPERRLAIPTFEQISAVRAELAPHLRGVVDVLVGTGARISETCGLTTNRLDLEERRIHFDRQLVSQQAGGMRFGPLKSKKVPRRIVPIADTTASQIAEHLDRWPRAQLDGDALAFATRTRRPVGRSSWSSAWNLARRRAGLPELRTHDVRHWYASGLIAAGESVLVVQRRLGHASPTETLDTYGHLWPENEDSTRAALEAMLSDEGKPRGTKPIVVRLEGHKPRSQGQVTVSRPVGGILSSAEALV